ncbi:MAG: hypothetical protein ACKPKO_62790, partial [Candidatus Fonsibacter sp.]
AGTEPGLATEAYRQLVQQANEQAVSWVDTWAKLFNEKPTLPKRISATDLARIEARMETREDYCGACMKVGMRWGNHRSSKAHKDMLAWHASCDQLMGPTRGPRAYSQGMPLPSNGVLDDKDLVAFWGDEVMQMGAKAMAILKERGILRVAKSRAQEHIKPANIVAAQLAFVAFSSGSGQYEDGKARLRWPQSLPCRIPPPRKVLDNA